MSADRWQYLLLLAACLVLTAPLEFVGGGVYRQPARLARAVLPVTLVLAAWDLVAIARGHWWYSPVFTTGVVLPGRLPVEEVLFFLAIPVCAVLTYEAVGAQLRAARKGRV